MSHIVIDAREYATSTGRYIAMMLKYLQHTDTTNDYTVLLRPNDLQKAAITAPNFTKLPCPYKEFTFQEQIGLLAQLNSLKPDLVHFGMTQQPVRYKGKTVTTIHDLITVRFTNPAKQALVFKFKQQIYKWVVKKVARTSNKIITPTNFVKEDLATFAGINPDKIIVTYESADAISDAPEPMQQLEDKPFIMYLGRPTPHKNLERLIQAFMQLKGQHPDLQLVLAGKLDANYRAIQQKVEREQIANIIFTGFVTEGQLRWLYEHCRAYIFPSLSEGFGLPGLEAMVHGAPVVSSNASCLPEVYGDAAHYFDPLDSQVMADAINEVLTDKQLRQQLITRGRAQAAKYSWERMAKQTLDIYRSIIG
jgi:glycosyltransferase involved in cell wall biosynthesis